MSINKSVRSKMRLNWSFWDNSEDILRQFGGRFDDFGTLGEVGEEEEEKVGEVV